MSPFIEGYTSKKTVGLLFAVGAILSMFVLIKVSPFLRKYGNRYITLFFLSIGVLSFSALAFSHSPFIILPSFVITQSLLPIIIFNFDLFLESFSRDDNTGTLRGFYLTLINLAIFAAPFLAGFLLVDSTFGRVFITSAFIILLASVFLFFSLRTYKDPLYVHVSYIKSLQKFYLNKPLRKILSTYFLISFFHAWFNIYLPIYLHTEIGFPLPIVIGFMIPVALLPFLLVQFPVGKIVDKKHNERELLVIGFVILGGATVLLSFLTSQNIILWILLIAIGRIGLAMIEVVAETFFYKKIDASNPNLISVFDSLGPLATIVAPLLATLILFPFHSSYQYLFLILGLIMFLGVPLSLSLKRTS